MLNKLIKIVLLCMVGINAQAQQQGDPPDQIAGLLINRNVLIQKMAQLDMGYTFKKGEDVQELPCFIARDDVNTKAIIVGKEGDLRLAKISYAFSTDTAINRKAITKMATFAYVFALEEGMNWFYARFPEIKIGVPYKSSKEFSENRKMEFEYSVEGGFILSVTPYKKD